MKRRLFLSKTGIGSLALATAGSVVGAEEKKVEGLVRTPPVVMGPRADGAEVIWAVSRLSRGLVEWKQADGSSQGRVVGNRHGFTVQGDELLKVPLVGLEAGKDYLLRVVTEAIDGEAERVESDWVAFRTLDPDGKSTRFVVWNDTHAQDATVRKLHELTPKADFLVWNGDTCNDWHREEQLVPTLLHPGGTDFTNGRPLCLVMGNHDVRGKYGFRVPECTATPSGLPYYAFRSGPVALVFLNTGEDKPDDHPSFAGRVDFQRLREEQALWLEEVVKRPEFANAPYRVVVCHIPLRWVEEREKLNYAEKDYDHYARSSRDLWHESLVKWGAQVVISGHTHREMWIPAAEGFPYAQYTGGGPQLERARYLEVTADDGAMRLVVRDMNGVVTQEQKFSAL